MCLNDPRRALFPEDGGLLVHCQIVQILFLSQNALEDAILYASTRNIACSVPDLVQLCWRQGLSGLGPAFPDGGFTCKYPIL